MESEGISPCRLVQDDLQPLSENLSEIKDDLYVVCQFPPDR